MLVALAACRTPESPARQAADDEAVTAQVKKMLLNNETTRGLDIGVETSRGVVTLTGTVDNEEQRTKAALVASSVGGCRQVNNLLRLRQ
jgi:hyperosmotically inducible protein